MRRVVRGDTANVQARRLILLNLDNLTDRSIKNARQRSLTGQSHRGGGIPSSHGFPFRKNAHTGGRATPAARPKGMRVPKNLLQ